MEVTFGSRRRGALVGEEVADEDGDMVAELEAEPAGDGVADIEDGKWIGKEWRCTCRSKLS